MKSDHLVGGTFPFTYFAVEHARRTCGRVRLASFGSSVFSCPPRFLVESIDARFQSLRYCQRKVEIRVLLDEAERELALEKRGEQTSSCERRPNDPTRSPARLLGRTSAQMCRRI